MHFAQPQLKVDTNEEKETVKEKVDEDGTVYEWDEVQKAWFPKVTQDFLANYQANYGSMREPITSPTGVKFEWRDDEKNYFNEQNEPLPEEGFQHEGVTYTYSIETNSWLADGKPLEGAGQQQNTFTDENGTVYFWNDMKKLWVTEAGICYNQETGEYSDSNTGKVYDATKVTNVLRNDAHEQFRWNGSIQRKRTNSLNARKRG